MEAELAPAPHMEVMALRQASEHIQLQVAVVVDITQAGHSPDKEEAPAGALERKQMLDMEHLLVIAAGLAVPTEEEEAAVLVKRAAPLRE